MTDLPGLAIADHFYQRKTAKLWVEDLFGSRVEMPVLTYFRDAANMPDLERIALAECRGRVLDIGSGAGSHALALQERGFDVTALDLSPAATDVAKARGVKNTCCADIFRLEEGAYDTLLLLMNGIGLTASPDGLALFLQHARKLLLPGGQLLFDSSDIAYMYEDGVPDLPYYYGMVKCRYHYRRMHTDWFTWLYIDRDTLQQVAAREGWSVTLLYEDEEGQYLVRLLPGK